MRPLDRRTLLKTSAIGALAATVPVRVAAAGGALGTPPALFLYDKRYPESLMEAQAWEARGVRVRDVRSGDLGLAWREAIAPLVARHGALAVRGRTLGSDRMISAIFAHQHGLRLVEEPLAAGAPVAQTRAWRLA